MHTHTLLTATFLALAQFTLASPPGCLLGAVNTYSNPADVKSVCQAKDLSSTVAKFCGGDSASALEALADICNGVDVKIATDIPTSTAASAKPSGTGSGSGYSASPSATGGAGPSGSGNAAASGSSTASLPQSTGAAGRIEVGVAALVAGLIAVGL